MSFDGKSCTQFVAPYCNYMVDCMAVVLFETIFHNLNIYLDTLELYWHVVTHASKQKLSFSVKFSYSFIFLGTTTFFLQR